ncbi:MAG: tetratricopeptide repeat protein [Myxococcales bacterium]|nr:tetratricopeptide repeat protein [Myxococcales bacterium]
MTREIPDDLHNKIVEKTESGNVLCEAARFEEALEEYRHALNLLPEPFEDWEASSWILGAIGDCHFLLGAFEAARHFFQSSLLCAGGMDEPFYHLRWGQSEFELGNMEPAKQELARAYMLGGATIFAGHDPKYISFLREFMRAT